MMHPDRTIVFRTGLAGLILVIGCAGCPRPYELGFPGPLPVRKWFTHWREDMPEITVYYPDTAPAMQQCPMVVFTCGWNQPRGVYESYGTQFAQWGYLCIIRGYPSVGLVGFGDTFMEENAAQISMMLDWCEQENQRPESPLFGMMDTNNVGTTGHSFGASVSILAALADERIRASAPLDVIHKGRDFDPTGDLHVSHDAFMFIGTSEGGWCARPPGATDKLFDHANPPAVEVILAGGDHMDFEDTMIMLNIFGEIACPRGSANPQQIRNLAMRYMVAWFNVYLKGQTEFEEYFNGTVSQQDEENGLITSIRRKLEPVE